MASIKKKATKVKKKVTKTKKSVAKKKKSLLKTTTPQDPQFESLIRRTMRQVGPKKFHLDPNVYTEEYFRERLPAERRKANPNLDYIPDYHHLKNLAV